MLWEYIGKVLSFAFRRTTPTIDSLQILAASAVPAGAWLIGFKMAANVTNDVLAYIGAVGVVFVMLRLLSAPYFIWREQVGEIGALKLELSRPEQIELERIARIRAKARIKLAGAIRAAQLTVFMNETDTEAFNKAQKKIARLAALTQIEKNALDALAEIQIIMDRCHVAIVDGKSFDDQNLGLRVANLCNYLHGSLTDEALAHRQPLNTEPETQP
jgi:hypothetical protein